jgi:hypothetical protein
MMSALQKRNASVAAAHAAVSDAIKHLDQATIHGDELDCLWLAGIIQELCAARYSLAEHVDINMT